MELAFLKETILTTSIQYSTRERDLRYKPNKVMYMTGKIAMENI